MSKTKVNSFINQVIAKLKGDENQVVAEKNFRKAVAAVKGQIAALESKLVEAEMAVEAKEEELANAKYPTTIIQDTSNYIYTIVKASDRLEEAKSALDSVKASIAFNKALLTEFEEEV